MFRSSIISGQGGWLCQRGIQKLQAWRQHTHCVVCNYKGITHNIHTDEVLMNVRNYASTGNVLIVLFYIFPIDLIVY